MPDLGSLLAPLLPLLPAATAAAQEIRPLVLISEFMASNGRTLRDRDGDWSDWIELFNPNGFPVDLGGFHLTDSAQAPTRWTFPSPTVLAPGGFLVVFASDKDRRVPGAELHTSFRLDAGGEYLALLEPNGRTVCSEFRPQYPPQSADVSFGLEWRPGLTGRLAYFVQPTPGRANGIGGAWLHDVAHAPARPRDADDVVVTCRVALPPGDTVTRVELFARVQFLAEAASAMVDDGSGADQVAGDGVFTGVVPASASGPGQLVRWRVVATTAGGTARSPLYLDPNGSPLYHGTVVVDPAVTTALPVLECFAQSPGAMVGGTRCALFYDGVLYDNVFVRERGGSSAGWPKPSWKFDFNSQHHFRVTPGMAPVEEINVNSTYGDKAFVRQVLAWETYANAGASGSLSFPLRLQLNGRFHSVAVFVEQPDEDLLRRNGLDPDGALYKMYNECTSSTGGVEKKTRQWENNADLQQLVQGVTLSGTALWYFLMDHVDMPAVVDYMAATVLMHDNDHVAKNYYLYRDTLGDGEWRFLPWDKDLTFGRNYTLNGGVLNDEMWARRDPQSHPMFGDVRHPKIDGPWNRLVDAVLRTYGTRRMFFRRLRTLMDEQLQPPGTPTALLRYEQRITALRSQLGPDAALDRATWGIPAWGSRALTFEQACDQLVNDYLTPRRQHLYVTHGPPNGQIPAAQSAGSKLVIANVLDATAAGDAARSFVELHNCSDAEIDASGWQLGGGIAFTLPPGCVVGAHLSVFVADDPRGFRARGTSPRGNEGHLVVGPWSGTLQPTEPVTLYDRAGLVLETSGGFAYSLTADGSGGGRLVVAGAPAAAELFCLVSTQTTWAPGCGPAVGLGNDALGVLSLPLGSEPFHVTADAQGGYAFTIPAGSLPRGFVLDSRVAAIDATTSRVMLSHVRRVVF